MQEAVKEHHTNDLRDYDDYPFQHYDENARMKLCSQLRMSGVSLYSSLFDYATVYPGERQGISLWEILIRLQRLYLNCYRTAAKRG